MKSELPLFRIERITLNSAVIFVLLFFFYYSESYSSSKTTIYSGNKDNVLVQPIILQNSFLMITIDSKTGAVVDILNLKTKTGYMKTQQSSKPPFIIDVYSANQSKYIRDPFEQQSGGFSTFDPGAPEIKGDLSHLRDAVEGGVSIISEKDMVTCRYKLSGGIIVTYSVSLQADSPLATWNIQVENGGGEIPQNDLRVYRVAFPVLESLRIGDNAGSNFLARPFAQGELILNPSAYEFKRPNLGTPINVLTYPGWASMSWQDMYDENGGGLYLASYDVSFQQLDLETWPDKADGTITMDMRCLAFLEPGQTWKSQKFEMGIHEGDWHWGADRYREWVYTHHRRFEGPDWVRKDCDGWLGIGRATESYKDYLSLFKNAQWLGLNYLQIWSEMLENVGPNKSKIWFYCFLWPNPDRGGEAEITNAVREIRSQGGHIGFYHNIWTWDALLSKRMEQWQKELPPDIKVPAWWSGSRNWASVFPDGSRKAGDFSPEYAGMCPAAEGYQDYVLFWVADKYVKQYGVDAWYFDSMPVTMFSGSRICFSDEHGQKSPHGVGQGFITLLERLKEATRTNVNLAVTSETVCDALMQYNSHALGLELIDGITRYLHPEIYTYTFTEHAIFSGSCNGAGSGLKYYYPDMTGMYRRQDAVNRSFLMGYRFDILDNIDPKDTFSLYLRQLISLRQQVKTDLYNSAFRDEIGLSPTPEKVYAKLFRRKDGGSLIINLIDRRKGIRSPFILSIDLKKNNFQKPGKTFLFEFDNKQTILLAKEKNGQFIIQIPPLTGEVATIRMVK